MNILLVDDHQMMRDGLRAVLERESDLHVTGEAADGRTALELCTTLHPDVVVMDIGMPGLNGIEATRQVTAHHPRTRVVALSMNADRRYVHAMFEAGAWAYLVKSSASEELIRAIRAVAHDEKYVSPTVASAVLDAFVVGPRATHRDPRGDLSPREREVLQLLAEGRSMKEAGDILNLTPRTVAFHKYTMMETLGIQTGAELVQYAVEHHVVSRRV